MIELAIKTNTAASRIGNHNAVRETMGTPRDLRMGRQIRREANARSQNGQEVAAKEQRLSAATAKGCNSDIQRDPSRSCPFGRVLGGLTVRRIHCRPPVL